MLVDNKVTRRQISKSGNALAGCMSLTGLLLGRAEQFSRRNECQTRPIEEESGRHRRWDKAEFAGCAIL